MKALLARILFLKESFINRVVKNIWSAAATIVGIGSFSGMDAILSRRLSVDKLKAAGKHR